MAAVRFLDYELFLRSWAGIPVTLQAANCVPDYVSALVAGADTSHRIVASYYRLVHPWLPIVSKRKIYRRLLNPLLPARVDASFLLLCMSLIPSSKGIERPDRLPMYLAALNCLVEIQRSGLVTPEILQGCILLTVYEQGHAIYPAAEISISISLRYALSLGMGWDRRGRMMPCRRGLMRRRKEGGRGGLYMFSKGLSRLLEASIFSKV